MREQEAFIPGQALNGVAIIVRIPLILVIAALLYRRLAHEILWHLDIFRRSFREISVHACTNETCIVCALRDLFSQLKFSQESTLPLDALHRILAENFHDQQKFQFDFMDDATECFETILLRIHLHIASSETADMCNARHCIPHQKFAMILVEQSVCGVCGATSEPLPFTQMIHYVSASTITLQARHNLLSSQNNPNLFGQLLRHASGMGNIRECPSSCGAKIQICRTLINRPEIISIGIVWDSERPSVQHIIDVFATINISLRLSDVFHSVVDSHWRTSVVHNLVGVITYYGKHYSTFFFHTKLKRWIYFDDVNVKEIGPRWEQVIDQCCRRRYQPLLLLYTSPCTSPTNTKNVSKINIINNEGSDNKRRSITPNPEKPSVSNTARRAITPNPDSPSYIYTQKLLLSDYQNLIDIPNNISNQGIDIVNDNIDSKYVGGQRVENVIHQQKEQIALTNSLNSACSPQDIINIREHLNISQRRDSGNWSGDRNSASSSSSTTMDNPYLYIVNKMHKNTGMPKSPLYKFVEFSNNNSAHYDAGYDSYSLSSTDSLPLQQNLKHNLQLAQIPEQQISTIDCERLWIETDTLMGKAQAAERAGDLGKAVILCTAATGKAREAMNIPYSNSNTIDLAKKKHNSCVIRMSYLQKKIKQEQAVTNSNKDEKNENRHLRDTSKLIQYSRQNCRDKGNHSRQNSRELLVNIPALVDKPIVKSIEIYATLPKNKTLQKKITAANIIKDEEYILYNCPMQTTELFKNSRHLNDGKKDKKRALSEDRNKNVSKELSIVLSKSISKLSKSEKLDNVDDSLKYLKNQQINSLPLINQKQNKKQHRIRRKLLMSGLTKRKNQSMPDLRENQNSRSSQNCKGLINILSKQSIDDLNVRLNSKNTSKNLCGYLSEGHLEFTNANNDKIGSNNPNIHKSHLMQKNFHNNIGKVLQVTKVPPPPPLRTTSQLSKSKPTNPVHNSEYQADKIFCRLTKEQNIPYQTQSQTNAYWTQMSVKHPLQTSPSISNYTNCESKLHSLSLGASYNLEKNPNKISKSNRQNTYNFSKLRAQDDIVQYANSTLCEPTFVITQADIHNEQITVKQKPNSDFLPPYPENGIVSHSRQLSEEFPPPPYPILPLVSYSQDGSDDFPPPPSPIENINQIQLNESIHFQQSQNHTQNKYESHHITNILSQLKLKREQMRICKAIEKKKESHIDENKKNQNKIWIEELQAKQAERRFKQQKLLDQDIPKTRTNSTLNTINLNIARTSDLKIGSIINTDIGHDVTDYSRTILSSVRDIAAKFEQKVENIKSHNRIFSNSIVTITQDYPKLEDPKLTKNIKDNIITNKLENEHLNKVINPSIESSLSQNMEAYMINDSPTGNENELNATILSMSLTLPHENGLPVDYPENDISDVAMQNTLQNVTILPNNDDIVHPKIKKPVGKKKTVSFCDQVVLVATAEDDEKNSYIPNPILERVLRSAMNKPETAQVLQEIKCLQKTEMNSELNISMKFQQHTLPLKSEADNTFTTLFKDQLKCINSHSEHIESNLGKLNLSEEGNRENQNLYPFCESNCEDIRNEQCSIASNIPNVTTTCPSFQRILYTQNTYPEVQTLRSKHQNIIFPQTEQSISPYSILLQEQCIQNSLYPKGDCLKTTYPSCYKIDQQNNQMRKQFLSPQQQQNITSKVFQEESKSPITIQQQHKNSINQQIENESANSIISQQQQPHKKNQFNMINDQSTNSDSQHFSENLQYLSANTISQPKKDQHFNYYQCTPNLTDKYQYSLTHLIPSPQKCLQIGTIKIENYMRHSQNVEQQQQIIHSQSQNFSNVQVQSHMKYPTCQNLQQVKHIKPIQQQTQQIHKIQSKIKGSANNNQNVLTDQKLTVTGMSKVIPCHLCRKKQVSEPMIYCSDCNFYMSRFRPKN